MNTETRYSGAEESLSAGAEVPLAVAADRPDAAPKAGDDGVRIVCHVVVLVAVLALVAYCVIWAPRRAGGRAASVGAESAAHRVIVNVGGGV